MNFFGVHQVVADLFELYSSDPAVLPGDVSGHAKPYRAVADYIAGMTDRFALREHQRLTGQTLFP